MWYHQSPTSMLFLADLALFLVCSISFTNRVHYLTVFVFLYSLRTLLLADGDSPRRERQHQSPTENQQFYFVHSALGFKCKVSREPCLVLQMSRQSARTSGDAFVSPSDRLAVTWDFEMWVGWGSNPNAVGHCCGQWELNNSANTSVVYALEARQGRMSPVTARVVSTDLFSSILKLVPNVGTGGFKSL